jgi:MFS family permease
MLLVTSVAIACFSLAYAASGNYWLPLVLVVFHGLFWSGLLSASAAYMTEVIPEKRRAEGIGYWGMATMLATAVSPGVGLWLYDRSWALLCVGTAFLNVVMAAIAWHLPPDTSVAARLSQQRLIGPGLVEWRVVGVAMALFLCSFGYGGLTSFVAVRSDELGIPRSTFFVSFATTVFVTVGLAATAAEQTRVQLALAAAVFGLGFGNQYPAFVGHVIRFVDHNRRGAAFGGILAAFDTGVGTGSIAVGAMASRIGFGPAFGVAAGLSAFSIPYFVWAERRFLERRLYPRPSTGRSAADRRSPAGAFAASGPVGPAAGAATGPLPVAAAGDSAAGAGVAADAPAPADDARGGIA